MGVFVSVIWLSEREEGEAGGVKRGGNDSMKKKWLGVER